MSSCFPLSFSMGIFIATNFSLYLSSLTSGTIFVALVFVYVCRDVCLSNCICGWYWLGWLNELFCVGMGVVCTFVYLCGWWCVWAVFVCVYVCMSIYVCSRLFQSIRMNIGIHKFMCRMRLQVECCKYWLAHYRGFGQGRSHELCIALAVGVTSC